MASKLGFGIFVAIFSLSFFQTYAYWKPKVFNVKSYGAKADGKTDNSQAFLSAWKDACKWKEGSRVLIPSGDYMLNSMTFVGPCYGAVSFSIEGAVKAPTDPKLFFTDTWIKFQYVDNLTVEGGGYLDGQGASAWKYNDCLVNPNCPKLPVTLRFDFVTHSAIQNIQSINSKNAHMNIFACKNINIRHVKIVAPENSPNTDGIHIGSSNDIRISHVNISTGDDCIAMVSGSQSIRISDVSCGPGHGISIGSLGRSHEEEHVKGIEVWNSTFKSTQNGIRIKTWSPSEPSQASDFIYQNIYMDKVENPVVIDQNYCPSGSCGGKDSSRVQISNVTFKNIWGTSASKIALSLHCSKLVPCQHISLVDINLVYNGRGGPAVSNCSNVDGSAYGKQLPPGCIKR